MTRCYLDTNFLYAHLRAAETGTDDRVSEWRARVLHEVEGDSAVISALVLDELAYRLVLAWLREDGSSDSLSDFRNDSVGAMKQARERLDRTWTAIDLLRLELQATDGRTVATAKALMVDLAMPPRDAFHAAHAFEAQCPLIASADDGFDRLAGLRRIGPRRD